MSDTYGFDNVEVQIVLEHLVERGSVWDRANLFLSMRQAVFNAAVYNPSLVELNKLYDVLGPTILTAALHEDDQTMNDSIEQILAQDHTLLLNTKVERRNFGSWKSNYQTFIDVLEDTKWSKSVDVVSVVATGGFQQGYLAAATLQPQELVAIRYSPVKKEDTKPVFVGDPGKSTAPFKDATVLFTEDIILGGRAISKMISLADYCGARRIYIADNRGVMHKTKNTLLAGHGIPVQPLNDYVAIVR